MKTHTLEIEFDNPTIPATVFVLQHRTQHLHGLYGHFGVHGLAVFSTAAAALIYSTELAMDGMMVAEIALDQAQELVLTKPEHVTALIMVDTPEPFIWVVR